MLQSYKLKKEANVLCVDDDLPTLNLVKQAIETAGFNPVAENVSANVLDRIKDMDIDDDAFKSIEAIIYSMTPKERSTPEILNGSRRERIAKGSGTSIQEVNKLIKQFDQTRKMMKMMTQMKGGKMPNMRR